MNSAFEDANKKWTCGEESSMVMVFHFVLKYIKCKNPIIQLIKMKLYYLNVHSKNNYEELYKSANGTCHSGQCPKRAVNTQLRTTKSILSIQWI